MILLFIFLLFLLLYRIRLDFRGFSDRYLSKEQTTAINGLFIVWVFIRHVQNPYIFDIGYAFTNFGDRLFRAIDAGAGQLIVVMFLFYSGFGVMSSIIGKGEKYVREMPQRRMLTTLLNYEVAIGAFLIVDLLVGVELNLCSVLKALVFAGHIGNSTWYIFAILCCYAAAWGVARIRRSSVEICLGATIALIGYWVVIQFFRWTPWYDTIMCFPLGMWYAAKRDAFERVLKRWYWVALPCFAVLLGFLRWYITWDWHGVLANFSAILFALCVLLVTMKAQIINPILSWGGGHLFPLYMYMRIPMIALSSVYDGWIVKNSLPLFVGLSAVLTVAIAYIYPRWQIRCAGKRAELASTV